ncbi:hypothetical protein C8034_v003993 [Colletotrichum sidae]|uniref:Ipa protein n=1 Tax=Colletotrichum sidae TaxID=1347389 RepID=A0A4R8T900_9PEZI|nr:hypothetical protein C8034_v003993 [Colletotrichum sidae]
MDTGGNGEVVKDLFSDLSRKWKRHGATLAEYWRSFDKGQRTRCVKVGALNGDVLKHPMDASLGNVCKLIPEWNLRDLTDPSSDHLIKLLRYRATAPLVDQYMVGPNYGDGRGDLHFIEEMMDTRNLRLIESYKNSWTFFLGEEMYGTSLLAKVPGAMDGLEKYKQMRVMVPQETGELVLMRQLNLLQALNIIVEDILEEGSKSRKTKTQAHKSDAAASAALAKLKIDDAGGRSSPSAKRTGRSEKLSLADLIAAANDQKAVLGDYLAVLSTEPVLLAHEVNFWFFSRPELVPDEKGRSLPQHTDRFISRSVLDAVHNAVKGVAVWTYLGQLLERLESVGSDKMHKAIILQEISNLCHLEFARAQSTFKRHAAMGSKWFKRMSNAYDAAGNAKLTLKGRPDDFLRTNPQLHYILRLCQPDTTAAKAVEWIKKLSELHENHPDERENLTEGQINTLCDLVVIVSFIQDLSSAISIPAPSRKKGQLFVSRSQELEAELNQVKSELDLGDFAVPIDNLLEPGMAEGALKTLDEFVVEKAGTKLGFLYQDLVQDCFADLGHQYDLAQAKAASGDAQWTPLPVPPPEPRETLIRERRLKEKTRPSHSSAYEIVAPKEPARQEAAAPPAPKFKVSASTADVFTAIFQKAESRRAVGWAAFEGAMADLGFSVVPKYGSVFTFLPPKEMGIQKPFTVHRPHKSQIEGYVSLVFAQRLKRVYGWGVETFEVA